MSESSQNEEQVSLPTAELTQISNGISLLPPLSRRGYGPGLIIILPEGTPLYKQGGTICENGIPPPLLKWAEEGFAVAEIRQEALQNDQGGQALKHAVTALKDCSNCHEDGGIGLIAYESSVWSSSICAAVTELDIKAAVIYGTLSEPKPHTSFIPSLHHLVGAGKVDAPATGDSKAYSYPTIKSSRFAVPGLPEFDSTNESVSHTRNLTFIKKYIRGADFDLEAIWDEHTYFEFEVRSVPKTMSTMVQEPYVNHIPTMTGGIGRERLTKFYRHHFVFSNPKDTELALVSRTLGIDRVVDEFIFKFTHDMEIDWLIPGIPPTGKRVEVPFTSVVCVRGDRLYHEHISWDQASILVQLGLMPEYLPYPYPLPDGTRPGQGKRFEYRVPAGGIETSIKMVDKNKIPSNQLFECKIREVDK